MAAEAGLDWFDIVVGVVGIAGGLAAGAGLFLHFKHPDDRFERYISDNSEYRAKLADRLENPGWANAYRDRLTRSLAWLDRNFGRANSGEALGTCVVIALCYAWVAFFLGYALSGSGNLGNVDLLPKIPSTGARWAVFALTCLFPPLAFIFGRRLGRLERLWKTRFRRRRNIRSKRRFERHYRIVAALAMGLAILSLGLSSNAGAVIVFQIWFFIAPVILGPAVGVFVTRRVRVHYMWRRMAAFAVSVAAGAIVGAGALAVPVVAAIAGFGAEVIIGAVAGAVVIAVPIAGTVAGALAGVLAGAVAIVVVGAVAVTVSVTGVGSGAVAVAVAGAGGIAVVVAGVAGLGAVMTQKHHDGAITGAIAGVVLFALLFVIATD
ncbi:MAG: hypothetical protein KIT00_03985, partial [Rhodospirillales bacterium]|nr:hypothetical protein [Rhodospirillales bacterium]